MALFHLEVKMIGGKESKRTATAAAAYRHRLKTEDKNYSLKGGVVAEMFLTPKDFFVFPESFGPIPEDAIPEKIDPMKFWECVDRYENQKRKDSQKAREVILSLHKELTLEENKRLVKKFVEDEFVSLGMTADVVIHQQPENPDNIHAHIMLTTRKAHSYGGFLFGFSDKKERAWNKKELVIKWRENWARLSNSALKKHGKAITEKSYVKLWEEAKKQGNYELAEIYELLMQIHTHKRRFEQGEMSKGDISLALTKKRLKLKLDTLNEDQMIFILEGQKNAIQSRNKPAGNSQNYSTTIRRFNIRTGGVSHRVQLNGTRTIHQEYGLINKTTWGSIIRPSFGNYGKHTSPEKTSSEFKKNSTVWESSSYSKEYEWLERKLAEKEERDKLSLSPKIRKNY